MSYQHVICLSNEPRKDRSSYPHENPLPDMITDVLAPEVDPRAEGEAIIEVSIRHFVQYLSVTDCTSCFRRIRLSLGVTETQSVAT